MIDDVRFWILMLVAAIFERHRFGLKKKRPLAFSPEDREANVAGWAAAVIVNRALHPDE